MHAINTEYYIHIYKCEVHVCECVCDGHVIQKNRGLQVCNRCAQQLRFVVTFIQSSVDGRIFLSLISP